MSADKTPIVKVLQPIEQYSVRSNGTIIKPEEPFIFPEENKVPEPPSKSHMILQIDAGFRAMRPNAYNYVTFVNSVSTLVPTGIKFSIGDNRYTLTESCIENLPVIIPKKTVYTESDDMTMIPKKLCDDMEFYLEEGTQFTIPKDTIIFQRSNQFKVMQDTKAVFIK